MMNCITTAAKSRDEDSSAEKGWKKKLSRRKYDRLSIKKRIGKKITISPTSFPDSILLCKLIRVYWNSVTDAYRV